MAAEITYKKKVKIGKEIHEFEVKGENLHEVVKPLSFGDVEKCGICGSQELYLAAHVAKGKFKYTTIKCRSCKASLNFGQQQEDPTVYYLKTATKEGGKKGYDWQSSEESEKQNQSGQQQFQQQPPQQQFPQQGQQNYQQNPPVQQQGGQQIPYYPNQQNYQQQGGQNRK